ncbi:ABC-F family ATP-binding cassette domain-containing protein [Flavobacteriales bacterium]|nr:ABC-F family ATP-binding cassette domain-containing protein [Flavobacteriales bacterium]
MNYISIENISKSFGINTLFDEVTFGIDKGDKIALVAKNGKGKSTLLKIITGSETPDTGQVIMRNDTTIGFLDQADSFDGYSTIKDYIFDSPKFKIVQEYEDLAMNAPESDAFQEAMDEMNRVGGWDAEQQAQKILFELGHKDFDRSLEKMSGGEHKRLALAKVLLNEPDVLILDEPTNHLDLDMIEWLEEFLSQKNLTLFMVTHDRYFLESICSVIIELDQGETYKYKGNYSYYLEKRAERFASDQTTIDKAKNLMKKELEWLRRQPKARGTKQKARVDAFDGIKEAATKKIDNSKLELKVLSTRLGTKILEFHNVSKSFDDNIMLDKFTYNFKRNEKIGIVGKNGVGKTTFINMIMSELNPDSGKIVTGDTVKFGYYNQKGMSFKPGKKVIEVVKDIAEAIPLEKGKSITAAQLLEKFFFPKDMHYQQVELLSGGEKKRLYLLTILLENPNFLILDEPTNDLDIYTIQALENFLSLFQGCLIVISHDRYFIDKVCDHIFYFKGKGLIKDILGNYTKYRELLKQDNEDSKSAKRIEKSDRSDKYETSIEKEGKPKNRPAISNNKRKEFMKLEDQIAKLEIEKKIITEKMYDASLSPEGLQLLADQLKSTSETLDEKSMQWLEIAEMMEGE